MKEIKYATLFGGAMNIPDSPEYLDTIKIGSLLADKGFIVKNGGYRGMMEAVSRGARESGGEVIGYTCKTFYSTVGNDYLSKTVVCETIFERLQKLIEGSSLFIVQRGGVGTLSDFFFCLDIIRKIPKVERPKVILVGDCWKKVFDILKQEIIPQKDYGLYTIVKDYKQLKGCL